MFTPTGWRIVRAVGLEYLALVFLTDLVIAPVSAHTELSPGYLPFSILLIAGALLRLAAAAQGVMRGRIPIHQAQS